MWQFPFSLQLHLLSTFLRSFGYPIVEQADTFQANMRLSQLSLGGFVSSALATNLWISSYAGNITSVQFIQSPSGAYSLKAVSTNDGCAPQASWLTKDEYNDAVYCVEEGFAGPNGTISSYKTSASGELTLIDEHSTIDGPVATVLYNGGKELVNAH